VKAEGTSVEYDPFPSAEEMENRRKVITEGRHPTDLWNEHALEKMVMDIYEGQS
jgi:hypothetical protein